MTDEPEIRFFKAPSGHNIAYAAHGEGPLVICPAWWVSHVEKDWAHAPFREFVLRLGKGLRIVRYDRPGVGLSDRRDASEALEDEVTVLTALARELGEETFSFFAASCGGPSALVYAARNPDAVEKICFYGTYACGADLAPPEIQQAILSTVRAHWGMGSRAMADIFLPEESRAAVELLATQQRYSADVETAAKLLKLTYEMDATAYLKNVEAECLVVHRRGDRAVSHDAGRALAAALKNARLVTLDGRAHPPWVSGDRIADIANAFFLGEARLNEDRTARSSAAAVSDDCQFDRDNRCFVIEGKQTALTPLEFAVMVEFTNAPDQVLTRDFLLEKVWKQPFEGSNRIDALIRGLRRKLGDYAPSIETVTGHGYRFAGWIKRAP